LKDDDGKQAKYEIGNIAMVKVLETLYEIVK